MKDRHISQSDSKKDRPKDLFPDLYIVSCPRCKLNCNLCYNCPADTFLKCTLVPDACTLKHNIIARLKITE